MTNLPQMALEYAGIGWYVFPIKPDTKEPATQSGHRNATTDPARITQWWTQKPNYLIGIWCRASGFIVVDVDGAAGAMKLAELEALHGALPRDCVQQSNSGGLHILLRDPFYDADRDVYNTISDIVGNLGGAGVIDIKCNGYFIVEPSQKYEWQFTFDFANPPIPPPVPDSWLPLLIKGSKASQYPPPPMSGELSARVTKGREILDRFVTRDSKLAPHIHEVLSGKGGENCETGNMRVGKLAYTIGREAPEIGADACLEIMRDTIAQINGPKAHSQAKLHARAMASYMEGTTNADPVTLPAPTLSMLGVSPPIIEAQHRRIASFIPEIRAKSDLPVIWTPWLNFNECTGGLELNSMTLAVGYQGSGKSSQAAQLAAYHARSAPVVYYLGEMGGRIFAARMIGQALKRSWRDVLRGKVSDEEMHRVLDPLHLYIVPAQITADAAVEEILKTIEHVKSLQYKDPILLIIDYVQLLGSAGKDMRQGLVTAVRVLQTITETENIATWMLSQGSRASGKKIREGVTDSIDLVDTGAESAELERSATLMFALSYKQKNDSKIHEVTMDIGKRRFGGPTKLAFEYDGVTGLFTSRDKPVTAHVEQERNAIDDKRVLERIEELTAARAFVTARKVREMVPGIPDKRVRESLARLQPTKIKTTDAYGDAPMFERFKGVLVPVGWTDTKANGTQVVDPSLSGIKVPDED